MGLAGMPPVLLALLLAAWLPEAKAQAVTGLADTDAQVAAGDAVVSTISLTFTTTNHNTVQTVTVTGVDDNMDNPGGGREVTHQPSNTGLTGAGGVSETDNLGISTLNAQAQTTINICDRTPQVKAEILTMSSKTETDCDSTLPEYLARIASINLRNRSLIALKAGDFDNLTSLTELRLHNNSLSSLRTVVFNNLTSLERLHLQHNSLSNRPACSITSLTSAFCI